MDRLKRPATWTAIALLVVLGGAGLQQAVARGEDGDAGEDSL